MNVLSPLLLCSDVAENSRPVLGVMARPRVLDGVFQGKQGPVLLRYLIRARQEHVFACVFDPASIDTRSHRLLGYVLSEQTDDGLWWVDATELPIPQVVYDQISSRRYENAPHVQRNREYLRMRACVFNDGFFDKWEVQSWLASSQTLARHLPVTALLTDADALQRFLEAHDTVFVKPVHGSLGIGIVRLVREQKRIRAILRLRKGHSEEEVFGTAGDLFVRYGSRWRHGPHLMQEGLDLLGVSHRPFDIRVILQRDREGRWRTTKMYVRVAAEGEFTSNLSTGGEAIPLSLLLRVNPRMKPASLQRDIRRLIRLIPGTLEKQSGRTLGELGIDLGVDVRGRLYIIEVNSKPWKAPETVHGSPELVELSFARPIRFAIHLANAADARGETSS